MVLWVMFFLLLGVVMVFGCVQSLVGLGVSGLMLTVVVSILLGIVFSYWVGMAVFLVYVGGLMVLFCYFIVIVPNQRFRMKFSGVGFFLGWVYMGVLWLVGSEVVNFSFGLMPMDVGGLFCFSGLPIMLILVVILLLTLVGVVEVVELGYGPLRPFGE